MTTCLSYLVGDLETLTLEQPITVYSIVSSVRDGARYFIAAGKEIAIFSIPAKNCGIWPRLIRTKEQPGNYFSYANLNFGLLAEIIEKFSNERFDIFMVNRIFEPLVSQQVSILAIFLARYWQQRIGRKMQRVNGTICVAQKFLVFMECLLMPLALVQLGSKTLFSPQGGLELFILSVILRLLRDAERWDQTVRHR